MKHIELGVEGMTCGGCSGRLNRVLAAQDGVSRAVADHAGDRVEVDFDPSRIGEAEIRQAITEAGFSVRPA